MSGEEDANWNPSEDFPGEAQRWNHVCCAGCPGLHGVSKEKPPGRWSCSGHVVVQCMLSARRCPLHAASRMIIIASLMLTFEHIEAHA